MSSPRWRKVLADLRLSHSRTLLVVLSIAIGVFAVGTMLTARMVLHQGVDDSFEVSNPASAVLMTEPFDADVVAAVEALPGVAGAEGRTTASVRIQLDDGSWGNLTLIAIPDYGESRIDRVLPESGAWPPALGEILIERASLADASVAVGDQLVIETPDGAQHTLQVGGVAYDPGQVAPVFAEDQLSGYITLDTLAAIGQPAGFNELHIVAAEDPRDLAQGEWVAGLARDQVLAPAGIDVHRIAVHDTPRYHSTDLGDALLLILGVMGGLVLILGAFLVINTVNALLAQQVRQIGMMKAIGGNRRQIASLYAGLVIAYGVLAALVAIPLAAGVAWLFTNYLAGMLNIDVTGPWFPPSVLAIELGLGLLVPLLAAMVPVLRASGISVREAITSYGLSENSSADGLVTRAITRLRGLSRPVRLSLSNTFRRRGRLALTLATLALGGSLFASVTSIQSSLDETLTDILQYADYDVQLTLDEPVPAGEAVGAALGVEGVEQAEGWFATNASRVRPDGSQNSNIWLMAPPAESTLVQPSLIEGRWLEPGDGEALVVNVDFQAGESVQVGDVVTLWVEGQQIEWPVVGVVSSQLMGPVVYAPLAPLGEAIGSPGEANRIMLVTTDPSAAAQTAVAERAEQQLRAGGLPIVQVDTQSDLRGGTEGLFSIVVMTLYFVGGLLAIVGALGLAGAMSLNVLERTREIGVMRAIGASNGMVARIVIVEGLVVGLLSWLLGALVAVPLGWVLSSVIGNGFLQAPLAYRYSFIGLLIWLAIVVVISIVASVMPARRAWRLSVREVLAYE
jgi:putative ABC transport system permease protein